MFASEQIERCPPHDNQFTSCHISHFPPYIMQVRRSCLRGGHHSYTGSTELPKLVCETSFYTRWEAWEGGGKRGAHSGPPPPVLLQPEVQQPGEGPHRRAEQGCQCASPGI